MKINFTKPFFFVAINLLLVCHSFAQQTITLTGVNIKDAALVKDTRVGKEYVANTNYSTYPRTTASAWTNSGKNVFTRSLIHFNLQAIPLGSTIQSATLYFYSDPTVTSPNVGNGNSQLSGSNAFFLEKIVQEWDPNVATWNNQPTTTTTDRILVAASTSATENKQINLTTIVQGWVSKPVSNSGLKLTLQSEVFYRSRNYASTNHPNSAIHPKLVITFNSPASVDLCGTPDLTEQQLMALPWYGNENFLINYNDSLEQANGTPTLARAPDIESPWLRIPLQFWVYQIANGNPGGLTPLPDEVRFQRLMDNLNDAAYNNGVKFRFYIGGITFVNDASAVNVGNSTEERTLAELHKDFNAVNVHIVDELEGAGGTYNPLYNAIFIERRSGAEDSRAATLTHEVGHFFGVLHTHFASGILCLREPVTRNISFSLCPNGSLIKKRCSVTGDLLCDTEADPDMSAEGAYNTANCTWDPLGKEDYNNDLFRPDPRNIMAYANDRGNPSCRTRFSTGQKNIIHNWAYTKQLRPNWFTNDNNKFDRFEPDDNAIAARPIVVGETQSHTFHVNGRVDNVDWLRFQHPVAGSFFNYRLVVTQVDAAAVGNVNINVRNGNGTAGARINGVTTVTNGNVVTYTIPCNLLTPDMQYLIELPRGNGNTRDYTVAFQLDGVNTMSIAGPALVCSANGTFTLANLPAGSTGIVWSQSSNVTPVSGQGTTNYIVRGNGTGTGWVSAAVTGNCGGSSPVTRSFNVSSGGAVTFLDVFAECFEQIFETDYANGASIYTWSVNNLSTGSTTVYNNRDYRLKVSFGAGNYRVNVGSACSGSATLSQDYTVDCGGFASFAISPNPASEVLSISQTTPASSGQKSSSNAALQSFEVSLFDDTGNTAIQPIESKDGRQLDLDIKGMKKGQYILQINQGDKTTAHHIQIE